MEAGRSSAVDVSSNPDLSISLPVAVQRQGLYIFYGIMSVVVLLLCLVLACLVILICFRVGACCCTALRGKFLLYIIHFLFGLGYFFLSLIFWEFFIGVMWFCFYLGSLIFGLAGVDLSLGIFRIF